MEKNKSYKSLKNISIFILITLMLFVSVKFATAMTCDYDAEPIFDNNLFNTDKIQFICYFSNPTTEYYCSNRVIENNITYQNNPEPVSIKSVGLDNQYFISQGGINNMYFTNTGMLVHHNYTISVSCTDKIGGKVYYNFSVIPVYRTLDFMNNRALWIKENAITFILIFILLVIIGICVYVVVK